MAEFTHLTANGSAHMVDVTAKQPTVREATATAKVTMAPATIRALRDQTVPKGDVLAVARIAGIAAAKKTPELLPLAHIIGVHGCTIDLQIEDNGVKIEATVRTADRTGVEMEALTAVTVAALAMVDMVKGIDRTVSIKDARIIAKSGGRSGDWKRPELESAGDDVAVIILAGGRAERLGGMSKPDLQVADGRLLDLVVKRVKQNCSPGQIVVVAPDCVTVPAGCLQCLEEPPFGGPVAGIAAGLQALAENGQKEPKTVVILPVDAPAAPRAIGELLSQLTAGRNCVDAVLATARQRRHNAIAACDYGVLKAALAGKNRRDTSLRSLFDELRTHYLEVPVDQVDDIDTLPDLGRHSL